MSEPPAIHYSPPSPGATGGRSNNSPPLTQIGDRREMRSKTASFSLPVQSHNSVRRAAKYGCTVGLRCVLFSLDCLNYPIIPEPHERWPTLAPPCPRRVRESRSHYDKVEVEFPPAWQQFHQQGCGIRWGQRCTTTKGWEMTRGEAWHKLTTRPHTQSQESMSLFNLVSTEI